MPARLAALKGGELIAADSALEDARTRSLAEAYLSAEGVTSLLDAPILMDGQVCGVMSLEHIGPQRRWSPEARLIVVASANLAAVVLDRIERQRIADELRKATEAAAAATKAKSDFLANI